MIAIISTLIGYLYVVVGMMFRSYLIGTSPAIRHDLRSGAAIVLLWPVVWFSEWMQRERDGVR